MNRILLLFCSASCLSAGAQTIPSETSYNAEVAWAEVFTNGPSGKVNRGIVDSDGHCVAVSMPNNKARIVKADGSNGQQLWATVIDNRVGFGVCEVQGDGHPDYIVSGGTGGSQERWLTRVNGLDGSVMWDRVYDYAGGGGQFDGLRTVAVCEDGMVVASGFVQGDESDTIFVVYAGSALVMKVNPSNGDVIWESVNGQSEYALATVQIADGSLFSAGVFYDEGLSITKRTSAGNVLWTEVLSGTTDVIPYDLAIGLDNDIYYGGHTPRSGAGDPFDYTCIRLNEQGEMQWMRQYANPRGYSLAHIRNELYGLEVGSDGVYMFGGSGDESNYSASNPPFPSSDIWVGWVLAVDDQGEVVKSDVFSHGNVNSATEYGALVEGGYVIFNDTDAGGDAEVGMMKVLNGSNPSPTSSCPEDIDNDLSVGVSDILDVLGDFGCISNCSADVDGDLMVSVSDVLAVIAVFGNSCL